MALCLQRLGCVFALLFVFAALGGCAEEAAEPERGVGSPCSPLVPCPVGLFCLDGLCFDASQVGCKVDQDCPVDYKCLSTGLCQENAECETDFDCCALGDATCELVCQSFKCVGTACIAGQTEDCWDDCHKGERRCNVGAWTPCDAAPVTATEICGDGIDNDCSGQTDHLEEGCTECVAGESLPCETPCGPGTDLCQADGTWRGCDAATDCTCDPPGLVTTQPCGICGERTGTCSPDGSWAWSEFCEEKGDCSPGDEDLSESSCGLCGTQRRTCDDQCIWGDWSECQDEGECSQGTEEQESCGDCGGTTRICSATCIWGAWSDCSLDDGCSPGEIDEKDCGLCGSQTRTCDNSCGWGQFGPCTGEGSCSPGMVDSQLCGDCGSQERSCTDACQWGGWGSCQGEGICTAGDSQNQDCGPTTNVGLCEKGTSHRNCGSGCQWGSWSDCVGEVFGTSEICGNGIDEDCDGQDATNPDEYEPNDGCTMCTWLGEDVDTVVNGSFDNEDDDVDYFCFLGTDDSPPLFCPWCSEDITVELTDQTVGMDADLHLYQGYAACESNTPIAYSVTIGPDDESISWEETNDPDTDTYIIRVKNYEASDCWGGYSLSVKGLE